MPKRKISKTRNRTLRKQLSKNSSKEKPEWQITPYLGLIERPEGGCFLFDQLLFSPVRTHASRPEVESLVDRVQQQGTSHLSTDSVSFLANHRILVPKNSRLREPSEMSSAEWQKTLSKTPFMVRLSATITSIKMVLRSLETVISHIRKLCSDSVSPHLVIKFIFDGYSCPEWIEHFIHINRYARRQVDSRDNPSFHVECDTQFLVDNVEQFLSFNDPCIHINCVVSDLLSETMMLALVRLVDEGFRPHLIFQVSDRNVKKVSEDIEKCGVRFGRDGFSFRLMPVAHTSSYVKKSAKEGLVCVNDLLYLLDACHSLSRIELSQSWLYTDLKKRITSYFVASHFPCNACAGRAVFINGEGMFSGCHKQAMKNPVGKQKELTKALQDPRKGRFGRSQFAIEECHHCALRYFCGGVCDYISADIIDPDISRQVFQLHCNMKRHMLLHFFEDATTEDESNEQKSQKYRLISGNGRLDLVSEEEIA